jgi:excisionase family DNA binding protein
MMKPVSSMTKDPRRDGFATAEEAARFLGISRYMIKKMTQTGEMPYRSFGFKSLRIPWDWLLDQVEQAHLAPPVPRKAPHAHLLAVYAKRRKRG